MSKDNLDDFKEIKQGEYKRLKRDDLKNYHGYTARLGFKYFKLKNKSMVIRNMFSDLSAEIINGWAVLFASGTIITLGYYPNARFEIIERLLKQVKEQEE